MTRRQLSALERRVRLLQGTNAAAVGLILPDGDRYRLEITTAAGEHSARTYDTIEQAQAGFNAAGPAPDAALVLIDL